MTDEASRSMTPTDRLKDIRAVLFDLDGTLIDTVELIRVSFRYATRTVLGEEFPDEVTMANVGQPLARQFHDMAPQHAEELLRVYREFNRAHHDELAKAYSGTQETLRELQRRGVPMGIVTSKGTTAAAMGIERFGLGGFMSVVVTADDVARHKPDPFPLEFAAGLLGVGMGYCMYLGDSPHDMQAALSANAIAVAALWGVFVREDVLMPGPPLALADIRDLPALLDGHAERFAV